MDGWNTSFLLGWPIFRGYVSFREGKCKTLGYFSQMTIEFHDLSFVLFLRDLFDVGSLQQKSWDGESALGDDFYLYKFRSR